MLTWSSSLDGFYHSFSSLEGGNSLASSSSSRSAPRAILSASFVSEKSFTPWRYSASAFQFPSPNISPGAPAIRDFALFVPDPIDRFALEADPLDALRAGEDLRADGRDFEEDAFEDERDFEEVRDFAGRDFEERDFEEDFFDEARDAEDFRPVFFARPELFDLPAALPAAFFFFMATGCSLLFPASPEPGSYNSKSVESRR